MEIKVFFEVCRENVIIPSRARKGDAGMDIYSAQEVIVKPGNTVIVPTGIKLAVPEGFEIQVRPRSGISLNTPLRLANSPGTIDSGYRGELGIIVTNISCVFDSDELFYPDSKGNRKGTYIIRRGERIAQIVLNRVPYMNLKEVDSVDYIGNDRKGGFGSTGTR